MVRGCSFKTLPKPKDFNCELFFLNPDYAYLCMLSICSQRLQNVAKGCYVHHGYNLKDIQP